ncbi:MAG: tripartite tricarboxylate transporter substrate binding protein [Hyphomicrobiales bacterium]|nr:tripartite tricarboxylate transporter substrate binding protein [Hyphomicrobiales bacterium]
MHQVVRSVLAAAAVASAFISSTCLAQQSAWPTRPIKLVIPFVAGGAADLIARAYADRAGAALGQSIIIENRGGAGGNIAASAVVRSDPDGYTLFFGSTGPAALNSLMYKNMTFDPLNDFTPIVMIGKTPIIIVARPNAPVKTLKELVAYAKANPGTLSAGFPGSGTLGHITGVLFGQRSGADLKHVQYRGGGPLITDLVGGHIDIGMDAITPYVPQVQDGNLIGLAVASAERLKQLPNVPTASEAGLSGFEASVWYCLLAPSGTPAEIVAKLNHASNAFIRAEGTAELFEKLGVVPAGGSPEELKRFMAKEVESWGPVIKGAKIEF